MHGLISFINELILWRPLLPYRYSYKTSCDGPG